MQNLLLILELVTPVFLIIILGYFLRRIGLINDEFISFSSKVVFTVALPALIFTEVSKLSLNQVLDFKIIIFVYAGTIISFLLVWFLTKPFIKEGKDRGVYIQGSFRGNFAIVGLALISSVYGNEVLSKAALVLGFTIPLYNVLSVIALTVPVRVERSLNYSHTFYEILKNPLIIAVLVGFIFSYFSIPMPNVIFKTVDYLAALALPLALLGLGGFMRFSDFKKISTLAFTSTLIKIVIIPFAAAFAAYELGFIDSDLGIIFILFGCPTAIASFIMADAMGLNSRLAGNILLLTTLFSILTITIGLYILKQTGLI